MFKTICLVFLFFSFISLNQLSSKEGIKTAVRASHAGDETVSTETVNTKGNTSVINGKVIKLETLEDTSSIATIKDSNGELHRCKML